MHHYSLVRADMRTKERRLTNARTNTCYCASDFSPNSDPGFTALQHCCQSWTGNSGCSSPVSRWQQSFVWGMCSLYHAALGRTANLENISNKANMSVFHLFLEHYIPWHPRPEQLGRCWWFASCLLRGACCMVRVALQSHYIFGGAGATCLWPSDVQDFLTKFENWTPDVGAIHPHPHFRA